MSHAFVAVSFACDSAGNGFLLGLTSGDGVNWNQFPWGQSPGTFLRDPSLMFNPNDSDFYVCATSSSSNTAFNLLTSSSLGGSWSSTTVTPSVVGTVLNVWAPHWFLDSSNNVHILVAINISGTGWGIYEMHPSSNSNLGSATWSTPALLWTPDGGEIFDVCVVESGGTFYAFYCGNNANAFSLLYVRTASSLTGTYSARSAVTVGGTQVEAEGPNIIEIGSTWYLYYDDMGQAALSGETFSAGGMSYLTNTSLGASGWTANGRFAPPYPQNDGIFNINGLKRCAVISIDPAILGWSNPIPNQRTLYAPYVNNIGSLNGFTVQQTAQFGLMRFGSVRLGTVIPLSTNLTISPAAAISQRQLFAPGINGGAQPVLGLYGRIYQPILAQ